MNTSPTIERICDIKYENLISDYSSKHIIQRHFDMDNLPAGSKTHASQLSVELVDSIHDDEEETYFVRNHIDKNNDISDSITIYTKQSVIDEFNDIFDNGKIDEFDKFYNKLDKISKKGKVIVKQKGIY